MPHVVTLFHLEFRHPRVCSDTDASLPRAVRTRFIAAAITDDVWPTKLMQYFMITRSAQYFTIILLPSAPACRKRDLRRDSAVGATKGVILSSRWSTTTPNYVSIYPQHLNSEIDLRGIAKPVNI